MVGRDFPSGQPANQTLISPFEFGMSPLLNTISSDSPPLSPYFLLILGLSLFSPSCLHSSHRVFIDNAMPDLSEEKVL